ncbi:MAG: ABC transporter substrate-binding protein [Chloroflexota bacterium]|nr:ABC transporter substrate-binding protein [Chloroflexota bacterium]
MKVLNAAAALIVLSSLSTGCRASPPVSVKVAILGPLSGNVKSYGEANRDGALLAIKEWNARDGVLGVPIEPTIQDCIFDDMEATAKVTTRLIEEGNIRLIVGGIAHDAITISRIAGAKKALHISASSADIAVTVDEEGVNKPYSFRAVALDSSMVDALAAFAVEELGGRTAAVLYNEENDRETHYAAWFRDGFEARGGAVPVFEPYDRLAYTQPDTYPWASLDQVTEAGCDALFLPGYSTVANSVARLCRERDVRATLLGSDAWHVSPDLDLELLEGSFYWTRYSPDDPRETVRGFIAAYEQEHGTDPDEYAALAYDATNILLDAVAKAGTGDPEHVREVMAELEFEGVTGKGSFDQLGNPVKDVAIVRIEHGERHFHRRVPPPAGTGTHDAD